MAAEPQSKEFTEGALSFDEAERLSALIRPSWELDDGAFGAGEIGSDEAVALAGGAALALESKTALAGSGPAPDTQIDGVPTVAIGESSPSREPISKEPSRRTEPAAPLGFVAPEPPKPQAAPRTQIGVGPDDQPPPTSRRKAPPSSQRSPSSARNGSGVPASSRAARASGAEPVSARGRAPIEDGESVELPVSGSKGMVIKVIVGAVALGAVIIGIKVFAGSDSPAPAPTPSVAATAATTAAPPPPPPAAETATAAPTASPATEAPTAAPTPTPTAAAEAPKAPAAEPPPKKAAAVAAPPPAKVAGPAVPPKPPAAGPKKAGGGIIRDAPF